jgi:hypothetical protein
MIDDGVGEDEMRRRYAAWFARAAEAGALPREKMSFYVKDTMAGMNVTGIVRYWKKCRDARRGSADGATASRPPMLPAP